MIFKVGNLGLRWLQSRATELVLASTGEQTDYCYSLNIISSEYLPFIST